MLTAPRPGTRALDAWTMIAAVAAVAATVRLSTLVSPASFRHPARAVVTADHVSGGRVELGLGTGWLEAEHAAYGFPFPPPRERMDRLADQLEIVHGHWAGGAFSFDGEHHRLDGLDARPKPVQRPPLIMGGGAGQRAAALAARYADEYKTPFATVEQAAERRARIAAACESAGRERIPLSVMTGCVIGADRAELEERAHAPERWRGVPVGLDALRRTWITGTVEEGSSGCAPTRRPAASA